jgi:hypothetical protein
MKREMIWILGMLSALVLATCVLPLSAPTVPVATATSLSFTDMDSSLGMIGGTALIGRAADESNLTDYTLYWGFAKRIVLVGDSIRMGWGKFLADYMPIDEIDQFASVNQNPSGAILTNINEWILSFHPDVVVMNAGLHELDIDQATYQSNLASIFTQIESSGAHIVYVSTTPVNEAITGSLMSNANIEKLNLWARAVVDSFGDIIWSDIYSFIASDGHPQKLVDGIHYDDGFSPLIAREISKSVQRIAPDRPPLLNALGTVEKSGSDLTIDIPMHTKIPAGATHLMVFASNFTGEAETSISIPLVDR